MEAATTRKRTRRSHDAISTAGCGSRPDQRIVDFERELVARLLRPAVNACRRGGVPLGLAGAAYRTGTPELSFRVVASDWAHFRIERNAHVTEGRNGWELRGLDARDPLVARKVATCVREARALLLEDRLVRAAGQPPESPGADHLRIHPIVGHALRSVGVRRGSVLAQKRTRLGVERNAYGVACREIVADREGAWGVYASPYHRNRLVCGTFSLYGQPATVAMTQDASRLLLTLREIHLPDAAIAACSGKVLQETFDCDLWRDAPPCRIEAILSTPAPGKNGGADLHITLERMSATIAQVWEGKRRRTMKKPLA